jgi:hypothetical protein
MKPTLLLLLLLPLTTLGQPCFSNNPNNIQTTFGFDFGFPPECDYPLDFMGDPMPCHGAFNRRPQFVAFTTPDTTWTFTLNTLDAPIDALVWSIWDGCPLTGGELVASVECGGWDCIEWFPIGFEATITLPAGEYWFWPGLYSDGETCVGGVVQGVMQMGGECEVEPEPEPLPCPQITVDYDGQTVTYCDGMVSTPIVTGIPCTPAENYATVAFTVSETPYPIHLWSDYNYVPFPNSPTNIPFIGILDACDGELIYTSIGGACSVGSDIGAPASGQEYTLNLNLPVGDYIAVIGFWAAEGNPYELEGCIEYTFGQIGFLNGAEPEQEQGGGGYVEPSVEYVPRYTKVVIEGRGVFIRDGWTGELFDVITRRKAQNEHA